MFCIPEFFGTIPASARKYLGSYPFETSALAFSKKVVTSELNENRYDWYYLSTTQTFESCAVSTGI